MAASPSDEEMPVNAQCEDTAPFVGRGEELVVQPRRAHALVYRTVALAALACVGAAAFGASHLLRDNRGANAKIQAAEGGIVSFSSDEHDDDDEAPDSWLNGYAYVNTSYDRDDYEHGMSVEKGDLLLIAERASRGHDWYFAHKVYSESGSGSMGRGFVPKWAVEIDSIKIRRAFSANESDGHTGCVSKVDIGDAAFPRQNHTSGWTWIIAVRTGGGLDVEEGWVPDWALHGHHGHHD
jgi:hypothetical protein